MEDFVTLDFIPEGVDLEADPARRCRACSTTALAGGGAKNINFQEVAADLAQITFDYPFRIPPYFALIIRAIGVLEGIALVGNPEFALVDEAYPYISKRLLTDDSPRLRESLRYMVYGKGQVFDADRLIDVLEAFESFRIASRMSQGKTADKAAAAAAAAAAGGENTPEAFFRQIEALIPPGFPRPPSPFPATPAPAAASSGEDAAAREALTFVLSPEGSFFREFLLDEAVKGIDALSRDNAAKVLAQVGLADARLPLLLPLSGIRSVRVSPSVTAEDRATVESVTKLLNFLLRGSRGGAAGAGASLRWGRSLQGAQGARASAARGRDGGAAGARRAVEQQAHREGDTRRLGSVRGGRLGVPADAAARAGAGEPVSASRRSSDETASTARVWGWGWGVIL